MIDACAFDAIESADVFDEMVLFSGRYFSTFNDWAWCPDDKCDIAMDYQNWRNDSTSSGNCMGAYLNDNVFGDYGWVKRDCSDTLVRVLCRLDCAGGTDSRPPTLICPDAFEVQYVDVCSATLRKKCCFRFEVMPNRCQVFRSFFFSVQSSIF